MGFCCRLGLAYAGSNREDVLTLLLPVMGDSKSSMEVSGPAAGEGVQVSPVPLWLPGWLSPSTSLPLHENH